MLEKGIKGTGRQVVTEKLTAKEMFMQRLR